MNKFDIMKEIEEYEDAYIDLSKWQENKKLNKKTLSLIGDVKTKEEKESMLIIVERFIEKLKAKREIITPGKLFLGEIIEKVQYGGYSPEEEDVIAQEYKKALADKVGEFMPDYQFDKNNEIFNENEWWL